MSKLKIAVIGVGYLGHYHALKYSQLDNVDLVSVVDTDHEKAAKLATKLKVQAETDYKAILGAVDAVSIAVPTPLHFDIANEFLQKKIHVLVEKPFTSTTSEADTLISLAHEHNLVLQVGHLERFNSAYSDLLSHIDEPSFIETHRLAPFKGRGTEDSVIMDLMIHDIDIILSLMKSDLKEIKASGAKVITNQVDIVNARLEFKNDCVANITASRISNKDERKMRVFQKEKYLSLDFQKAELDIYTKKKDKGSNKDQDFLYKKMQYDNNDSLLNEIEHFIECIKTDNIPIVSGKDARNAIQTATQISEMLREG
ncbi:MAG: Gfo/Idh/MocA family oxidoreductase [Pseudomonadota bacterium]